MLIQLWKYLCGYVIIEVHGFSVERFLNLATHRGIYLWNLHRDGNKLVMSISGKGFKMLRPCARKTRCKIKVIRKVGLPFIFHRYRKRRVFLLGLFLMLIVLGTLSSFIWTIEIDGIQNLSIHSVESMLEKEGCKIGGFKYALDTKTIEDRILETYPEISWIAMEVKGTGLFVYIEESTKTPEMIDRNKIPSNIRAEKDCIIEYIVTRSGRPLVKKGDVIQKGDLLVTGELEILQDDQTFRYSYVHADADIRGRLYYQLEETIEWDYIYKEFTGKTKKAYILNLGSLKLEFSNPFRKFEYYDKTSEVSDFYFFNYKLPIEIIKQVQYAYNPIEKTYEEDEAKAILARRIEVFKNNIKDDDNEIIHEKIVYTKKKNLLECHGRLTVIDTIGEKVAIKERKEWTEEENNPSQ